METQNPKIQKLGCLEDLELLVQGDVILMNRLGNGKPQEALYWGKNKLESPDFLFIVRPNDCSVKQIAAERKYMQLSKEGFLIVKPFAERTTWKDEGVYYFFDELLKKSRI